VAAGRVVALGDPAAGLQPATVLFTVGGLERAWTRAHQALDAFFREHPLRSGMPKEELKSRTGLPPRAFAEALAHWLRQGVLVENGALVAPPGRTVTLTAADAAEAEAFVQALRAGRYAPAPERLPSPELLAYLVDQGRVVAVGEGVVFVTEVYQEMVERIVAHLREHRTITLAQVRDMFGTSRKYAQALLEYMDQRGITRRVGDERVLR
jgi:selenocysteine-specific elongation factor